MRLEKNIYLIGFMGAGKSCVSRAMAGKYGFREIDTDEMIVSREGMPIAQIFEKKGEDYFRDAETAVLKEAAAGKAAVISCGGGVILREQNRRLMRESGEVILLSAKPETIYERVKNAKHRPLLNGRMNVEYIADLIKERAPLYELAKTGEVITEKKTPEQIAEEIYGMI